MNAKSLPKPCWAPVLADSALSAGYRPSRIPQTWAIGTSY